MAAAMDGPVDPSRVPSVEFRERLLTLVRGYRISQAVYVATRLGIPDLLADGPREIDELAHATGSHPPSLRRVLLALAGVGVLDKVGPGRFALTPMGAGLRTGVPGSLRPAVQFLLNESHWRPWGHLLHTVRTGETAFRTSGNWRACLWPRRVPTVGFAIRSAHSNALRLFAELRRLLQRGGDPPDRGAVAGDRSEEAARYRVADPEEARGGRGPARAPLMRPPCG